MRERAAPVEAVIDALHAAKVEYVLIGGAAMMLHGSAYVTKDIDICCDRSVSNVEALLSALRPFEPRLRAGQRDSVSFLWDARTILNGSNFSLETSIGDVNILGTVTGIGTYEAVRALAAPYAIGARQVPMLTVEGLIASKRAAGRVKDQLALPELEVMRGLERLAEEPQAD